MQNRSLAAGHLLALFVSVIWGTTFISTKLLLRDFSPMEIMLFRFIIAWLALFLWSPRPLIPKSLKNEWPFLAAGFSGLTLYFILENTALLYTMASDAGIIISAAPMFTALLLWLARRTPRPSGAFFLGFLLAMAGITLLTLLHGDGLSLNPLGDVLVLCAALSWGAYGVCIELTRTQGYSNIQVTRKVFFWGLLLALACSPLFHPDLAPARFAAAPEMLFHILYLGLGASALCFLAWNRAVLLIGPVATNVYIYLMPIITLAASALLLHEPVTPAALAAISLILLGLWLSQRRAAPKGRGARDPAAQN